MKIDSDHNFDKYGLLININIWKPYSFIHVDSKSPSW